jgi:hypothetical protein
MALDFCRSQLLSVYLHGRDAFIAATACVTTVICGVVAAGVGAGIEIYAFTLSPNAAKYRGDLARGARYTWEQTQQFFPGHTGGYVPPPVPPPDTPYRRIDATLYEHYHDEDFADLYHREGKPGLSPILRAFVTVFQALENLPDRKAAEPVEINLKWKYALHLPLDAGDLDLSELMLPLKLYAPSR